MNTIRLKKNQDKRIRLGYPWVFSNEIEKISPAAVSKTVRIESYDRRFIGIGYYNPNSLIAARILSRHETELDAAFFKKKLYAALRYRESVYPGSDSYRAVYGESDLLPGLIIDKYERTSHFRITAKGILDYLPLIIEAADSLGLADNIYVSADETAARLENMDALSYWAKGADPGPVTIKEHGLSLLADLERGQKTGYFFDQRENRLKLSGYVRDISVLDCFCYTGSFSLHASHFGAREVFGLDTSSAAVETAQKNAELNKLTNCGFVEEDAVSYLTQAQPEKKYGMVILDPPALIKTKKTFRQGLKKYISLNALAMGCIEPGGTLFTSSCSHHLDFMSFLGVIRDSARTARRNVQIIEFGFQAKDHPVLPAMPETMYLKSAFCRIS
ncbi:MAG: class I SAM-dependent rRNA methyltransferase [Elusimicrobia bacterium]|nr:class I SAM-dependent rRNA methyltransferase [Elusimicrobiota bacterium]